jgi:hypothetical protein
LDIAGSDLPKEPSALYIFTYSDFCEMPSSLQDLIGLLPFAYFMFVPSHFVREAFKAMKDIFKRQAKRDRCMAELLAADGWKTYNAYLVLSEVPFIFITLLQATLIKTLGCPIALIGPGS